MTVACFHQTFFFGNLQLKIFLENIYLIFYYFFISKAYNSTNFKGLQKCIDWRSWQKEEAGSNCWCLGEGSYFLPKNVQLSETNLFWVSRVWGRFVKRNQKFPWRERDTLYLLALHDSSVQLFVRWSSSLKFTVLIISQSNGRRLI